MGWRLRIFHNQQRAIAMRAVSQRDKARRRKRIFAERQRNIKWIKQNEKKETQLPARPGEANSLIISHHMKSRHVMSRHVTSRHVTSRHVTSRHLTSHEVTSHHIASPGSACSTTASAPFSTACIAPTKPSILPLPLPHSE